MKRLKGLNLADIAFGVCSAFRRANVTAVLVGGGAASFYAQETYETRDLDFLLPFELFGAPKALIIDDLGFAPTKTAGTYGHPDIHDTPEILQGPLSIGDGTLMIYAMLRIRELVMNVISPTDSVKNRLAHAIHFRDIIAARKAGECGSRHSPELVQERRWRQSTRNVPRLSRLAPIFAALNR